MWKWTVCNSVNHYLHNEMLPSNTVRRDIHQPEIFEFIFLPDSIELYQENIYREMLRNILDTEFQLTYQNKKSIMSYATDTVIPQIKLKDQLKTYLDSNNLVWQLMTISKYTHPDALYQIELAKKKLANEKTEAIVVPTLL